MAHDMRVDTLNTEFFFMNATQTGSTTHLPTFTRSYYTADAVPTAKRDLRPFAWREVSLFVATTLLV